MAAAPISRVRFPAPSSRSMDDGLFDLEPEGRLDLQLNPLTWREVPDGATPMDYLYVSIIAHLHLRFRQHELAFVRNVSSYLHDRNASFSEIAVANYNSVFQVFDACDFHKKEREEQRYNWKSSFFEVSFKDRKPPQVFRIYKDKEWAGSSLIFCPGTADAGNHDSNYTVLFMFKASSFVFSTIASDPSVTNILVVPTINDKFLRPPPLNFKIILRLDTTFNYEPLKGLPWFSPLVNRIMANRYTLLPYLQNTPALSDGVVDQLLWSNTVVVQQRGVTRTNRGTGAGGLNSGVASGSMNNFNNLNLFFPADLRGLLDHNSSNQPRSY